MVHPTVTDTLVINLFGGPGTGKSTTCAGVFSLLKNRGVNAEMALEFAKDKVWEKSTHTLSNQIYIFGKQHHRFWRLRGQVEVIVTDSPLLLSLYYGNRESDTFHRLVIEEHEKFRSLNFFLERVKPFNPSGRLQNEEQAKGIDGELRRILEKHQIGYRQVVADEEAPLEIAQATEWYLSRMRHGG